MRAPEVDSLVPCTHSSGRHDGHREDEVPPEILLSVMVYGVPRNTRPLPVFLRPPRILGKVKLSSDVLKKLRVSTNDASPAGTYSLPAATRIKLPLRFFMLAALRFHGYLCAS